MKRKLPVAWPVIPALGLPLSSHASEISKGDTAWLLVATAMVLFMIPGLALFYGGMARSKNVLGTIMHSLIALGVVGLQWYFIGFSLCFGEGNAFIGGFEYFMLRGIGPEDVTGTVPTLLYVAFQATFACITPALISGAIAERVKFGTYVLFILLWSTLVYDPVCHWVWHSNGFLNADGAIDFAGGTVVHIISGVAGLVACIMMGRRINVLGATAVPHNLVFTVLGAGMLWFGWFGFNAGSAVAADAVAALAFLNTFVSPAGAMVTWILIEKWHRGRSTALGAASGIVAGLVAVTPAAGSVMPGSAILLGAASACMCYLFVNLKMTLRYDDSLDAFGVHGIGGTVGALGCGVLASVGANSIFFTGDPGGRSGWAQMWVQTQSVLITAAYSAVVTFILVYLLESTLGFRLPPEEEEQGLDLVIHGERAYN